MSAKPPVFEYGKTSLLASKILIVARLAGDFAGLKIRLQDVRDGDRAVGLLVGLHQRHEKTRQSGPAAIEDIGKPVLAGGGFKSEIHTPGLKILAIGTTG